MGLLIPCRRLRIAPRWILGIGRISSRCDWPVASLATMAHMRRNTAPIASPRNTAITLQPDTAPATLPQQRKTVCCAEKSLSVGRRLSITGNHGIWRQISTIICRQTRNAPNQACHTSLPAAFAAATSASSCASLASDSPVMNFSTSAFASLSSCWTAGDFMKYAEADSTGPAR